MTYPINLIFNFFVGQNEFYEFTKFYEMIFSNLVRYQLINQTISQSVSQSVRISISQLNRLTISQTTNFRLYQTERICRRQFQICRKWQRSLQAGRKHCGKRRNCSLRAISPFPTVFLKDFECRNVTNRACLGKG